MNSHALRETVCSSSLKGCTKDCLCLPQAVQMRRRWKAESIVGSIAKRGNNGLDERCLALAQLPAPSSQRSSTPLLDEEACQPSIVVSELASKHVSEV